MPKHDARGDREDVVHAALTGSAAPTSPAAAAPNAFAFVDRWIEAVAPCPWTGHVGGSARARGPSASATLYTPEERARRDATVWTRVQAVLAPTQFLVFLLSVGLVARYLATGEGLAIASASIVIKTLVLYAIMVTGSIWEKEVFGRWLFARPFFWEDVVSMLVIALHTAYLAALAFGWGSPSEQMLLALAAYAVYAVNAVQFLLKLRAARLEEARAQPALPHAPGVAS